MPEPSILLCGPAADTDESAASLDVLRSVTLPNAAKYLVTFGKFDAAGEAKRVNVEAHYPADPPYLQTLLRWAEIGDLSDPRYRDGYDLYCLRQTLARTKKADYAVVLRDGARHFQERWPELQESVAGRLFLTFDDGAASGGGAPRASLLLDLQDERSPAFLGAAWELYRTGAVYGMEDYTLNTALSAAFEALELERRRSEPKQVEGPEALQSVDAQDADGHLAASEAE